MLYLGLPAALATGAAGTGVDVSSTRSAALITIGDQWQCRETRPATLSPRRSPTVDLDLQGPTRGNLSAKDEVLGGEELTVECPEAACVMCTS